MKTTRDFIAPRRKISLNQLFAVAVLSSLVWSKGALALCQPQPDCEATNTPPSVTLTAPTNGTTTTAPGTFVLTATATDDGAIDSVEFFSNNVSIGVDSSAPYSLSYGGLAVGSYAIKAKATDDLGVSRTSTVATVTVTAPANAPPTVNLTGPANGATATAPGSFTLTATAADSNGTIASVKFRNGATVLTTDTSYPYSYTYSELAAGSYAISAVATDNAGATATSATANVTVNAVANVAPTVTLTSPANGATSLPPASFSLTATAADSDGSVASVKFISNGALLATDSTSPYAYTYAAGAGSYAIQAIVTDNTGATATSATANITVAAATPVSETRNYVYDQYGRLCKTVNPESGATIVEYDDASNILWTAEGTTYTGTAACDRNLVGAAQKTMRAYDAMNRVTAVTTPTGDANVATSYYADGAVNTITAANPGGVVSTTYVYNKRRMLTGETSTNGTTVLPLGYGYDLNGHAAALTYPDGQTVTYLPDALGRATQVVAGAQNYATGITYYPSGAISGFSYGNGAVHTMTRNGRGLPARSKDMKGATVILDDSYAFDANGNVTDITDDVPGAANTRGMAYDNLDRLTSAVGPWGAASYTYDALDNIRSSDVGARKYRYTYDTVTQRLTTIKDPAGVTKITLGYDVNGNVTSKNATANQAFVFDSANRMTQVTGQQAYRYDGQGRRVQTTDLPGNQKTYWIYSQIGQVLYTVEARRSRNLSYIYLGNTQVATRAEAWGTGVITLSYQHTDALGSPVAETSATGTVTKRNSYAPYGEAYGATSIDGTGYTGHVMDQGTGLTYMQQRYYDPQIGRFLSVDPAASEFNRYNYANNNPYTFTDPDGRTAKGADGFCGTSGCDGGSFSSGEGTQAAKEDEQSQEEALYRKTFVAPVQVTGQKIGDGMSKAGDVAEAGFIFVVTDGLFKAFGELATALRGARAAEAGKGFSSFTAFKREAGVAGEGMHWHHVVEQTGANVERFGANSVHNTSNLVRVPTAIHQKISGYYSSKQPLFTNGQTVRQWLRTQSFAEQKKFGEQVMSRFGAP